MKTGVANGDAPLQIGILAIDGWMGGVLYTQNLIQALASLPAPERPTIYLFYTPNANKAFLQAVDGLVDKKGLYTPWLSTAQSPTLRRVGRALRKICRLVGEPQPEFAWHARSLKLDAVYPIEQFQAQRWRLKPIAWLPDFQHRVMPELFAAQEIQARDANFRAILGQRGDVVVSSAHALAQATQFYGTPKARLHVLRFVSVPEPSWQHHTASLREQYRLPRDYIILCNQFWLHKDHRTAFEAVRHLVDAGIAINLVCTGATDDYRDPGYYSRLMTEIKAWGIGQHVHILGLIPRADQLQLMREAEAVLQPSRFEGWSTVLEDARALGKRVIASDFPVHLEQNVPHALYFRQGDGENCARAIREMRQLGWQADESPVDEQALRVAEYARTFLRIVRVSLL